MAAFGDLARGVNDRVDGIVAPEHSVDDLTAGLRRSERARMTVPALGGWDMPR